jgi:hypothetical protein
MEQGYKDYAFNVLVSRRLGRHTGYLSIYGRNRLQPFDQCSGSALDGLLEPDPEESKK